MASRWHQNIRHGGASRVLHRQLFVRIGSMGLGLLLMASAAAADLVVIGHVAGPALSREQVVDVYLGRSQVAVALDQPDLSPLRVEFYRKATDRDLTQVKTIWSRLVFTGRGLPPREMRDSTAIKKAVTADPKTIGYIERSAVDGTVKVLWRLD